MTELPIPPVAGDFRAPCVRAAGYAASGAQPGRKTQKPRKSRNVARQAPTATETPSPSTAREANHRIMNNLSVLRSLVQMQRRRLDDETAGQVLDDLGVRLEAMALVHRQLAHEAGEDPDFDAAAYLREFVDELAVTMASDRYEIRFDAPKSARLPRCKATLLALLISELAINASKHAFPAGRTGEISVTLKFVRGRYRLTVADDGIGLPDEFDPAASRGIGMKLVVGFVCQLGGTLDIRAGTPGATFAVTFPA